MSTKTPYSDIGPFKYVPEDVRSRVASLANQASGRSLDAAMRAADAAGGGYEMYAYRPSTTAVTATWSDEDKHVTSVRKHFVVETLLVAALTSIFLIPAVLCAVAWADGKASLGGSIVFGAIGIVFFSALYFTGYKKTLRSRSDLKTQGFAGDALIDATLRVAGSTWLLGEEALVIAWANQSSASSTRAVFYDAIGTVTVTVENGLEGVTVTGRDGQFIGRLVKPKGYHSGTADGLAAEIRKRAEKSRKAA
ncbi:hypothetical protein O9X98_07485 [Agrobacterium salinitolerans]|nr:hypothetical protein [Agrobacterium salinitolerans]